MSYTKYYLYKKQYSTDGGVHWYDVTPLEEVASGDPIGHYETLAECQGIEPMYRWIQLDPLTDYYCSGTTKMYKEQKQVSTDGGATWENVVPAEYRQGGSAQTESTDCGYVPPVTAKKFVATYSGGQTYELDCDSNTMLTTGDTKPSGYEYSAMTSAVIGDCVTSISLDAFKDCSGLTSVTIPDSVESINAYAFARCPSLTSITIPNSVTSIWNDAFCCGTSIENIVIPNSVTVFGERVFENNTSLTSITLSNNITELENHVFNGCSNLLSLTIPDSVTIVGRSLCSNCTSLTSVTMPNSVTIISDHLFSGCRSLTSVTIPSGVTRINDHAFYQCNSLTSVTIPSGVTFIGQSAFQSCSGLTSVTVEVATPPKLGSEVFTNTSNCPIYVPAASVSAYQSASGWNAYASRIQAIP